MKKNLPILFLLPAMFVMLLITGARADDATIEDDDATDATVVSVTLKWDANNEPDLAGYNVYYGRSSGDYMRLVSVTKPTAVIGVKGSKTWYFAVTAYNTSGEESAFSQEVQWP